MNPRQAGFIASRRGFLLAASAGILSTQWPGRALAAEGGGKTLRFGLSVFPPSLSPWIASGSAAGTIKTLTMRGLLGYDTKGDLVGELAEKWSTIDAQTFEFTLRPNAVFSNGSPVRSADIEWSFQQITAPESAANIKSRLRLIEKFEIIDDKNFRLKLAKPFAILPYSLASVDAPILAIGSTEKAPIVCGPFRIVNQERGVFLQLERNETYYKKDSPKIQSIRVIAYADENLRMAALEAGDVDIIEYVPWAAFTRFDNHNRLKLAKSLGPYMLVQFNTTRPPFDNPAVRQAIGYAIRREDIVKTAFAGQGAPLFSFPNPPGSPFKTETETNRWTFDPQKAKAMLAKAGHPNGFNCTLLATSTYGMLQDTALVVAGYLQAIGINAELKLPEWASRIKASNEGEYDIAIHGTAGEYNDPDSLYPLLHSTEKSYQTSFGFKSQRIDALLDQGRSELDQNKRAELYKELAQAYFDEAPQVPLAWRVQAFGLTKNIEGFVNLPGFLTFYSARVLDEITLS